MDYAFTHRPILPLGGKIDVLVLSEGEPKIGMIGTDWAHQVRRGDAGLIHEASGPTLYYGRFKKQPGRDAMDVELVPAEKLPLAVGEFGRTPRLSRNANGTGRDHWPQAYTALVSGGGLKMGQVVGATNSKSEFPTDRPYSPHDLLATIYQHLGIDPARKFTDFAGRPVHILGEGSPIRELA